jgi:hypothetical protein
MPRTATIFSAKDDGFWSDAPRFHAVDPDGNLTGKIAREAYRQA